MIIKLLGLSLVGGCLAVIYLFEQSAGTTGAFRIFHWPAMVLTGLGPIGLLLLCSDRSRLENVGRVLFRSVSALRRRGEQEAALLQKISHAYYVKGPSSLDELDVNALSPYLRKAISRLAVRMPIADAREILERERERAESHTQRGLASLQLGVRLTPSVGMLGTILGMVELLSNLKDPGEIGANMGLALLTTFYGLFFSLVFWTPLEQRAQSFAEAESRGFDQGVLWLELLERRKPAQYLDGDSEGETLRNSSEPVRAVP